MKRFAPLALALLLCACAPAAAPAETTAPPETAAPAPVRDICADYIVHLTERYGFTPEADEVSVEREIGVYAGCPVVFMRCPLAYTQALRPVEVAGYTIVFPNGQLLYVYDDGDFLTLNEAYDAGLITADDVREIGAQVGIDFAAHNSPHEKDDPAESPYAAYRLRALYAAENGLDIADVWLARAHMPLTYGSAALDGFYALRLVEMGRADCAEPVVLLTAEEVLPGQSKAFLTVEEAHAAGLLDDADRRALANRLAWDGPLGYDVLIDLYHRALTAAGWFELHDMPYLAEGSRTLDGKVYYPVADFATMAELRAYLGGLFTDAAIDRMLAAARIEYRALDGRLYVVPLPPEQLRETSPRRERCFAEQTADGSIALRIEWSGERWLPLVETDDGWRFDGFSCYPSDADVARRNRAYTHPDDKRGQIDVLWEANRARAAYAEHRGVDFYDVAVEELSVMVNIEDGFCEARFGDEPLTAYIWAHLRGLLLSRDEALAAGILCEADMRMLESRAYYSDGTAAFDALSRFYAEAWSAAFLFDEGHMAYDGGSPVTLDGVTYYPTAYRTTMADLRAHLCRYFTPARVEAYLATEQPRYRDIEGRLHIAHPSADPSPGHAEARLEIKRLGNGDILVTPIGVEGMGALLVETDDGWRFDDFACRPRETISLPDAIALYRGAYIAADAHLVEALTFDRQQLRRVGGVDYYRIRDYTSLDDLRARLAPYFTPDRIERLLAEGPVRYREIDGLLYTSSLWGVGGEAFLRREYFSLLRLDEKRAILRIEWNGVRELPLIETEAGWRFDDFAYYPPRDA